MSKPKLYYFDAPVSRGEECRIALHLAKVDFEDVRLSRADWLAFKPRTPFGHVPVFELEGRPAIAEANAILALIGRQHGLHPSDAFEAARHEAMMGHVEELRAQLGPTLRMTDEAEKKRAREQLAKEFLPNWARDTEKQLGDGPFFGAEKLHVVDLKLYITVRWIASGTLDHVPANTFAGFPKLMRLHDAVRDDARVQAWYDKTTKPV